jgi:hypothetical protein
LLLTTPQHSTIMYGSECGAPQYSRFPCCVPVTLARSSRGHMSELSRNSTDTPCLPLSHEVASHWSLCPSETPLQFVGTRLESQSSQNTITVVRFEVFTAVTMKNVVFWDATPCGSCNNRRFGGTQRLHHQGDKNRRTSNNVSRN